MSNSNVGGKLLKGLMIVGGLIVVGLGGVIGQGASELLFGDDQASPPELVEHDFYGAHLRAPAGFTERRVGEVEELVTATPDLHAAHTAMWSGESGAVALSHYRLTNTGTYSLEGGLRGSLRESVRRMEVVAEEGGRTLDAGPIVVRDTVVQGLPAMVGSRDGRIAGRAVQLRGLVTAND